MADTPSEAASDSADDPDQLGATVRAHREQRGLTIASLARSVGVSAAAVSQIESGAVQPSLTTLRKLAASLGIPVFRFFLPDESDAVKVIRRSERKTIRMPKSGVRYQLLTPSLRGQLEVMELTLGPGEESAAELLSHAGEECFVVLSGEAALELNDATVILRAGDSATFQGGIPHRLRNVGANDVVAISAITPPSF
ncbi:MAG TPA: XRE family transcriptional regulator [Streptosporangiaceae bacterium]|nr:XRE family transcriptional regulator [Streptosporangiaceae bacterium]